MLLAKCYTSALMGIDAYLVEVEVDISRGLPNFNIVGLPDTAVREAKERITAAIKNSQFNFPMGRITINLAPADIKKEDSSFDLPMAISELHLSARAYHKILKIARTIADLDEKEEINSSHISEALQYRYLDKEL